MHYNTPLSKVSYPGFRVSAHQYAGDDQVDPNVVLTSRLENSTSLSLRQAIVRLRVLINLPIDDLPGWAIEEMEDLNKTIALHTPDLSI